MTDRNSVPFQPAHRSILTVAGLTLAAVAASTFGATSAQSAPAVPAAAAAAACTSNAMGIPTTGNAYLGGVTTTDSQLASRESAMGQKWGLHRSYFGSSAYNAAATEAKADLAKGRIAWVSFKEPLSWSQMANGAGNAWAQQMADALGKVGGPVWVAVHHEPEKDGDMAQWTKMQQNIAQIVHARTNNVAYTVIYSGWNTFQGGKTNTLASKWPGDANVDVTAIDAYNDGYAGRNGSGNTKQIELKTYYAPLQTWAKAHGTAWAIGETGQSKQAAQVDKTWLTRQWNDLRSYGGAALSYFDSTKNSVTDWTLADSVKFNQFKAMLATSTHPC